MKSTILMLMMAGLVLASSCNRSDQKAEEKDNEIQETAVKVSGSLSDYISLKNALVSSDPSGAAEAATRLEKSAIEENNNSEISQIAFEIAESNDLELQRELFKSISELMIAEMKNTSQAQPVYVQYCPMAFDDAGATWLSLSEEIENPYFGEQMLYCGSVEEEL